MPARASPEARKPSHVAKRNGARGERQNAVDGEAQHLPERVLGLARRPVGAPVGDRLLAKAGPGHHGAHEAVTLRHGEEGVHHFAVHEPEVAGISRNGDVGEPVEESVEGAGRPALEPRLAVAFGAQAVGDVGAPAPTLQHLDDDLGRVLEVGVDDDDDDGIAGSALQAGGHGDLMAEIAGQGEDPHARIGALQLAQEIQRDIAAAVVDIDELEVEIGDGFKCSDEAAMGLADDRCLVEAGDDDGQERAGGYFRPGLRFITGNFHSPATLFR